MSQVARAAVGTIQPDVDGQPVSLALLSYLRQQGMQLQHFRSRACFTRLDCGREAAGNQSRHLDSWLMKPGICREVFLRGVGNCDAAILDGQFDSNQHCGPATKRGSKLEELADWLGMPRILVLDVPALGRCMLPCRPNADAILLDRIPNRSEYCRLKTVIESIWGIPVVGGLSACEAARDALRHHALQQPPASGHSPGDLCTLLGNQFASFANFELLVRTLKQAPPLEFAPELFGSRPNWSGLRVAVAYDEAFHCYFGDMLDLLESRGARVLDFSLLRDEQLPDADVVFIGCGHPEEFADRLANNQCMILSLRGHVCARKPLYAEGGGMAFLCHYLESTSGEQFPMAGILQAAAFLNRDASGPEPVQASLAHDSWLGNRGAQLRGYLNTHWDIRPLSPMPSQLVEPARQGDVLRHRAAIGSRIHLDLAVQPDAMRSLVQARI